MQNRILVALGVVLVLQGCGDRRPSPSDVVGTYVGDLPAGAAPARSVTLHLAEGNSADMVLAASAGGPSFTETGTWALGSRGEVRVVLARDGFGPVSSDVSFSWARGTLTAVAFDTVQWGSRGFSLTRR